MGLVQRLFGDDSSPRARMRGDYLDLSAYTPTVPDADAASWVRFVEIQKLEDVREFAGFLYEGHTVVMDVRAVASDEITMRRVTNELKDLVTDVGGDIAGMAQHLIVLTPQGVRVDRQKHRAK